MGQSDVETILADAIEQLQGQVHWQTELVAYEQHSDHVLATVSCDTATRLQISAKFIVGADGCHSKVRKHDSTWTYEGNSIKAQFALADLVVEGADVSRIRSRPVVFYHSNGKSRIGLDRDDELTSSFQRLVCADSIASQGVGGDNDCTITSEHGPL